MKSLIPWLLAGTVGCAAPPEDSDLPANVEGDAVGECIDGVDNDDDGLTDCDDPGCEPVPNCNPDTGTLPDCGGNALEDVFPPPGTTDAFVGTVIEARFDDSDPSATLALTDSGVPVPGTVIAEDRWVRLTPDEPLQPSTVHEIEIAWGSGVCVVTTEFTTSSTGTPVSDPSTLVGRTYEVDFEGGRVVEPQGLGPILAGSINASLFLSPTAATSTEVVFLGGVSDEATPTEQSACTPTTELPAADFSNNPFYAMDASGSTTTVRAWGVDVPVHDLRFSGAFAADGTSIEGAVFAGLVDTRPLVDLVEEGAQEDAICELAASIGVECTDCGNAEVFCLDVYMDSITAPEVPGTTLTPLTDVCAQPDAETVCPDPCVSGTTPGPCSVAALGLGSAPALWLVVLLVRRRSETSPTPGE